MGLPNIKIYRQPSYWSQKLERHYDIHDSSSKSVLGISYGTFYHSVYIRCRQMCWLYQLYQKMSDRSNTRQRKEKAIITPERCTLTVVYAFVFVPITQKAKFDHLEMLNRFTHIILLCRHHLYMGSSAIWII